MGTYLAADLARHEQTGVRHLALDADPNPRYQARRDAGQFRMHARRKPGGRDGP